VRVALADATVRVILDVTRFDRDLQTKVAAAARRAGRRFDIEFAKTARQAAVRWSKDFEDSLNKRMTGAGSRAGAIFARGLRRDAAPQARMLGRDLGEQIRGGLLQTTNQTGRWYTRALQGSLTMGGNRLGQRFAAAIWLGLNNSPIGLRLRQRIEDDSEPQVLTAARTIAARFGAALSAAMGSVSIGRMGFLVAGVAGLVSEGVQLAAALEPALQAIGLLPAVATVAAASITTLVVAFKGMGDALSAAASGDAEELAEAMEKLSPAAQSVVKEFAALMPRLSEVRRAVQQAFFEQLTGDLTRLGDALIGPVQRGMTATASAAGRMASGLVDVLTQTRSAGAIEEIFGSTARAFDQMTGPMQTFTTGMLDWIRATLPAFDQLVASLGSGTTRFGEFLSRAAASGQAMAWVNEAITTISQLGRAAFSAGRVVGTIFDAANAAGGTYLTNLNDALIATRQFLAIGEGRTALIAIFEGIHQVVQSLAEPLKAAVVGLGQISRVAGSVSQAVSSGLAAAIRGAGQAIENAGPGLTRFAAAVGSVLSTLGDILPSIGTSLGSLLNAAAPLVSIFGLVARAGAALLSVVASLPGPLLTMIGVFVGIRALGLPNLFTQIQQRVGGLSGVFSAASGAANSFGRVFGRITSTYQANIASLTALRIQQQVAANAMTAGIPQVSAFGAAIGSLSDRARAAGGAIGGSLLRGAQSLIGALGGGIGIALTAASVLIGVWADEQAKADQAVAEHNQRVRQLGSTLDRVTGSITNATRAQAQQTFASSDLADAASRLGLSIDNVADAATGNEVVQRRMVEQLRNSARGALQTSGDWHEMELAAQNMGISVDVLLDALLGNESAMKRVQKATEGTEASLSSMQGTWGDAIPDQVALGTAINQTASELQKQADAIQRANAEYGPAARLADDLAQAMGVLADNSSSAADKARALDSALRLLNGGTVDLADAQKANADAIASGNTQMQQLADKYNIAGKSAAALGISTGELAARQAELGQTMFDSSGQLNFASERVRGLYDASKQLRQATLDQTAAIIDNAQKTGGDMAQAHKRAADLVNQSRQQIVQWATDAGLGAEAGEQLANMMGLIPENVKIALEMQNVPAILNQLSTIKGDIELLPDKKSLRLDSNARGMRKELEDLGFSVQDIPGSKDIKITPNTSEATAALQQFITNMLTSRNPEMKIDANTSAAELDALQLQQFIKNLPAVFQPGLNTAPVIAEWQSLLLGPLSSPPGTPTVTPGVDGGQVQTWFDVYLQGLVPAPGNPTITPGLDPSQAKEGLAALEQHMLPNLPYVVIVPTVDGKPATDGLDGILEGLGIEAQGKPEITPEVNGGPPKLQMEKLLDLSPDQQPKIEPSANIAPAQDKLRNLLGFFNTAQATGPQVSANTAPASTRLALLLNLINRSQATGPSVNGNVGPANAQLALLLNQINRSQGNVAVGANTGPAYGGINNLVGYANQSSGAISVAAATGLAYAQVNELVRYINSRSATVSVNASSSVRAAEGGLFKYFAGGGINTMRPMPANRAQIVPPRTMRVIGDRARGDEAFIPLVNSARSRSILAAASSQMGFDLVPKQAQQTDTRETRATTVEAGAIVVNAPYSDPFLVARAVINELTREAVV
jgi:hypothetical protein